MPRCIYKECQFRENYTSMPAWVRALFVIISFLLTTLNYQTSLSFTTIAILYIPLMNEYRCLSRNGRKSRITLIHKAEFYGTCFMLIVALLGVTSILQMDVSMDIDRIYINKEFPIIGGFGVSLIKFWMVAMVLTVISTLIDWQVTPKSEAREISELTERIETGVTAQ